LRFSGSKVEVVVSIAWVEELYCPWAVMLSNPS
jgi:hypothetical protein